MKKWIENLAPRPGEKLLEPATEAESVTRAISEIGPSATAWAVGTAARIVAEVAVELRRGDSPTRITGAEREACESSLLTTLVALHRGTPAKDVIRPRDAAENVRLSVRQGVPIHAVLRVVWMCHTKAQDALLREIAKQIEGDKLITEVRELSAALFAYVDSYVTDLTDEYEDELAAWKGRIPAERLRIMTSLLDGSPPDADAERILGLRLTNHHLVAVAWSETGGHVWELEEQLARFGAEAARLLDAAGVLVLHRGNLTEIWWTFNTKPSADYAERLRKAPAPAWMKFALGIVDNGLDGFRRSHFAASQAHHVGNLTPFGNFWAYEDIQVVALLANDRAAAEMFVRRELNGIMGAGPRMVELRHTARQFLRTGESRSAAAQILNVASNTVTYRIGKAGALLGRAVGDRPLETLLALDLAYYFPQFIDSKET